MIVTTLALTAVVNGAAPARTVAAVPAAAAVADVRVVHGSPDAGPVTVSVDGIPVLTHFLYGTVTPYVALKPGTYTLAVTTAGPATVEDMATVAWPEPSVTALPAVRVPRVAAKLTV